MEPPLELNFREVIPGRLFRCAEPSRVEAVVFQRLVERYGIRTVVDLRTAAERAAAPDPESAARVVPLPLFDTIEPDWAAPEDRSPEATAVRYRQMAEAGSAAMESIVSLFDHPENGPLLVHCAAGRDRTGIVVAALLKRCGASDDAIVADYAASDPAVGQAPAAVMRHYLKISSNS